MEWRAGGVGAAAVGDRHVVAPGTAPADERAASLLHSTKDRLEHELVVDTITAVLSRAGLNPRSHPRAEPRRCRPGRHTTESPCSTGT